MNLAFFYKYLIKLISDTPKITEKQIKDAENVINNLIRDGKRVTVEVYTEDTPEEELKQVITYCIVKQY